MPTGELLDGIEKRLGELRGPPRRGQGAAPQGWPPARPATWPAQAVDGVVVARVDGLARDDLRSLALAVRDQPGVRAVVLGGAPDGGGVALVAAASQDSGLDAGELIADAARTVGGGGGKNPDLAVAGGRDPSRLDEALDQARVAAGVG